MSILAIILARGGSKELPRKNIKILNDKPLIAYTIEEALRSKYIDRVIVSTEDYEIAEVSKKYNAEIPFLRPMELAKDETPSMEVVIHTINWLKENEGKEYDYICLLQCTSPLRTSNQIDEAIEILKTKAGKSIVSVCEAEVSPYWMKEIKDDYLVDFVKQEQQYTKRQEIPKVYRLNGAIYIAKTETILEEKSFFINKVLPYLMDKLSSVDIDDILDFKFAEMLIKERENETR